MSHLWSSESWRIKSIFWASGSRWSIGRKSWICSPQLIFSIDTGKGWYYIISLKDSAHGWKNCPLNMNKEKNWRSKATCLAEGWHQIHSRVPACLRRGLNAARPRGWDPQEATLRDWAPDSEWDDIALPGHRDCDFSTAPSPVASRERVPLQTGHEVQNQITHRVKFLRHQCKLQLSSADACRQALLRQLWDQS